MKRKIRLNCLYVSLLALGTALGFSACGDDDGEVPYFPPSVTTSVMHGNYTGKMNTSAGPRSFLAALEEVSAGVDITAKIEKDTVYFDNFPIKDIVLSIVQDEATAEKIVKAVGNLKYKIGYKPTLTAAKDSIKFVLDPKPLKLSVTIPPKERAKADPISVQVKVSPVADANYEVKTTHLKYKFKADEILIGEGDAQKPLPGFHPITFDFVMKKVQPKTVDRSNFLMTVIREKVL